LQYTISNIPTYIVVIGSLLVGLLLSWIISLVNDISNGLVMRGKENKIKDYRKESADLTKRIHQLELENTRLKAETNTADDEKSL
jgi:cell shape-determining protein MreC